jgi:hypothetical protein
VDSNSKGGAELHLSNVDLATATPRSAVEGGAIATFDRQNPFQSIPVRVGARRAGHVLGLPGLLKRVASSSGSTRPGRFYAE